jgi:hypothetical protein
MKPADADGRSSSPECTVASGMMYGTCPGGTRMKSATESAVERGVESAVEGAEVIIQA